MVLREFSAYLNRPFEAFEGVQVENFRKTYDIITSDKEKEQECQLDSTGFLNPHEENYMKLLIEGKKPGYSLFLLFDVPMRRTNRVIECLLPNSLVTKYSLKNTYNLCIQFSRFRKVIIEHKGSYDSFGRWSLILIDDFEVINPIKLRLRSAKESDNAIKLRKEILFNELDVETPPYVKLSILNTLFLSPKIESRTGIEAKSLISNSTGNRFLINLDNYNKVIKGLIPPEISNCHSNDYRGDIVSHHLDSIGEKMDIHINFPASKYYFNSICTPNQKEEINIHLRSISDNDIGINHQTKIKNYFSTKELIDKLTLTEFYYKQDYLPGISIVNMGRSLGLIKENQKLLYEDYAYRIYKPIKVTPLSVSEKHKIMNLAQDYCAEVGYHIKQGSDSYFNNVVRSINENFQRVKAILNRSDFQADIGLEIVYLESLQLNFDEVRDSVDYNDLSIRKLNMEKITKVMNNITRATIINALKIRGNSAPEQEVLSDAFKLGHVEKDVLKEIDNLQKGGIIYKLNNIFYLEAKDI